MKHFKQILLVSLICATNTTFAGANKDLRCQDWLNGTNAQYIGAIDRVVSYDNIGMKGVCKDFFMTWGERFKFERTNSSFFSASYAVTRQYCWGRNFIQGGGFQSSRSSGRTFCGGCRMKFLGCRGDGWTPPKYTSWGETYSAQFDFDEVAAGANGWSVKKVLKKGSNPLHHVCLRRYVKGEKFKHDENGAPHNSYQSKVCAYLVNTTGCNQPYANYSTALIGCIDEPTTPGPGVFNHTIIGQSIAFVDEEKTLTDYINLGSTFDQPLITLTNGLEEGAKKTLTLRYKFPNDTRIIGTNNYTTCGIFPDENKTEYCAQFDSSNPGSICACVKAECASNIYVGCVPRPNLEQSNLKIKTHYELYEDESGDIAPALGVQFMVVDSSGNEIEPLLLTQEPLTVREYYKQIVENQETLVQRDSIEVYGVKLSAMIPEFENDLPKYIGIGEPAMMFVLTGCYHFAQFPSDDELWPKFFVPAGTRNRDNCDCPSGVITACLIPPPIKCANNDSTNGQLLPHDTEAVDAYCPGYYTGFEDSSKPDKICVVNDTDFDFITQAEGLCAELNTSCAVSSYPSLSSGNALFDTLELERDQSEEGICDPAMGFEYVLDYSNSIDFSKLEGDAGSSTAGNISNSILKEQFTTKFQELVTLFESRNLNIPEREIKALESAFNGKITIGNPVVLKPKHICSGNGLTGKIENACRLKLNCENITKPSYSFFGATFVSDGSINKPIAGTCTAPFISEDGDIPNMECTEVIDATLIDGYEIRFRYWNRSKFYNPCENPERDSAQSGNNGSGSESSGNGSGGAV